MKPARPCPAGRCAWFSFSTSLSTRRFLSDNSCSMSFSVLSLALASAELACGADLAPRPGGGGTAPPGDPTCTVLNKLRIASSRPCLAPPTMPVAGNSEGCGRSALAQPDHGAKGTSEGSMVARRGGEGAVFLVFAARSLAPATASSKSTRWFPDRTMGLYWSFRACVTARFSKCRRFSSRPWTWALQTLLTLRLWKRWKRWSEKTLRKRSASAGSTKLMKA
mmetsp:Transcript_87472/g.270837  ORF Transcript_87472/g.270837 Transcript_87472/m.270837 type:complete len:222 (+) Transcript_87472:422-1087(+)